MTGLKRFFILTIMALVLSACNGLLPQPSAIRTPPLAQTQTTSPAATTSAVPLSTPSPGNALWATYQNKTFNYSFDYPAIYEMAPYKATCGLRDQGTSLTLGARIELAVYKVGQTSLEEFTRQFFNTKDWILENQDNGSLGGSNAINVNYRFGGPNRFGTLTLVKHNDFVVALGFTSGSFCADLPPEDDEASTYQHMLDTFQFNK